MIEMDDIPVEL